MATDEAAVPDGRCGFTLQPEDVGAEDDYNALSAWYEYIGRVAKRSRV
ncbi:hypothetical protein HLRTI_001537, partial [Halorhabdus tiamatea SARL4B]